MIISATTPMWVLFGLVIVFLLVLDLRVFHRRPHEVRMKEALAWSGVWITVSLLFGAGVYIELGADAGHNFLTGYFIEKALSMDNLFVFLVIFTFFGVPSEYHHIVLFWGILGALFFRAVFIAGGVSLIHAFSWSIYILGAFLVVTGVKLAQGKEREFHPEKNIAIRLFRRFFPVTTEYAGKRFFVRANGAIAATPLFITLLVVETTDIVFATDSIPAILGITTDPFIVYTSNIFAILGLRALYFVLAHVMRLFRFLHIGLAVILVFIGMKMLLTGFIAVPTDIALVVVFAILLVSILLSLVMPAATESAGKS
ncbi:MAG: TerC family protein [Bacteroidota bacterium]|nr:TerC family protein [Bacteroidota bacterium]